MDLAAGEWRGHRYRCRRTGANVVGPISTGHLGHSHTVPPTHNAASSHLTPGEKGGKEEWETKIPNLFHFYPKGTKKNLVVTECKQVVGNQVKLDNRKILHESAKYIPSHLLGLS